MGDWNDSYNNVNYPFVVGIEAITGNIGLSAPQGPDTPIPPVTAADKPVDSSAITFYAPTVPGQVVDAAVTVVQNEDQAAFFIPWAAPPAPAPPQFRLSAAITNLGSAPIS